MPMQFSLFIRRVVNGLAMWASHLFLMFSKLNFKLRFDGKTVGTEMVSANDGSAPVTEVVLFENRLMRMLPIILRLRIQNLFLKFRIRYLIAKHFFRMSLFKYRHCLLQRQILRSQRRFGVDSPLSSGVLINQVAACQCDACCAEGGKNRPGDRDSEVHASRSVKQE